MDQKELLSNPEGAFSLFPSSGESQPRFIPEALKPLLLISVRVNMMVSKDVVWGLVTGKEKGCI